MASKFLLFGTSLFRTTTTHKTLSSNPSFLTSKRFPSFSLHLRRYCSSVAAADTVTDNPQTVTSTQQQHPWPEWVTFVDRLKTRGYLVETSTKDDDSNDISSDATVSSSSSTDSAVYTDINRLRNPCLSFARDGYDVFMFVPFHFCFFLCLAFCILNSFNFMSKHQDLCIGPYFEF